MIDRPNPPQCPVGSTRGNGDESDSTLRVTGAKDGLVRSKTPAGIRPVDFNLFNHSSDLQFTVKGNVEFDDGMRLSGGFGHRNNHTDRNVRGLNNLSTQAAYLAGVRTNAPRGFGPRGATDVHFVYASDGTAYPANANGNGLVGSTPSSRSRTRSRK